MNDAKVESKYIEKDPPMGTEQDLDKKTLDYLAYLKEKLNFILANYGRRITDAYGNVNEIIRTAQEFTIRLTSEMVDSINIGARNLLRESGTSYTNTSSPTAEYYLTDLISDGEVVTLQVKGNAGADATGFLVVNSGDDHPTNEVVLTTLTNGEYDATTGIYSATFGWSVTEGAIVADNTKIKIYSIPADPARTASIQWIKLERGQKATDWTPAPEDLQEGIDDAAGAAAGAAASAGEALETTRKVEATMQFTVEGLKISGTAGSRDNSYVNVGADKQTFVVNNVEVMDLGADGITTQGDIEAAGTIKGGAFDTDHWTITENASRVWSLNYNA